MKKKTEENIQFEDLPKDVPTPVDILDEDYSEFLDLDSEIDFLDRIEKNNFYD